MKNLTKLIRDEEKMFKYNKCVYGVNMLRKTPSVNLFRSATYSMILNNTAKKTSTKISRKKYKKVTPMFGMVK